MRNSFTLLQYFPAHLIQVKTCEQKARTSDLLPDDDKIGEKARE